jgi:putative acetyltransferase
MHIRLGDLEDPRLIALLDHYRAAMRGISPPESCHALDTEGLRQPEVTLWTVWIGDHLAGCGALQHLASDHAEIKSMRTAPNYLRRGVAAKLLGHLLQEAQARGYQRVSLETGSMPYYEPARQLYARFGFEYCGAFGKYVEDPHSVFMSKRLESAMPGDASMAVT